MITPEKFNELLGKQINKYRVNSKFDTLEKIATQINLTKASLSAMENGKQTISAYQIYTISKLLDVSIEKFFEEIDYNEYSDLSQKDLDKIKEL